MKKGKKRDAHPNLPGLAEPTQISLTPAQGCEEPVVWLRTLAVHSDWPAESGTLLREVKLRRGLNILWAEPVPTGTKNRLSGHATGKTTFCRLVRYVLDDADAGTKDFRQRFQAKFPRGWAFGEVVIVGEVWLVGRPLGRMGYHPFARKGGTLADLKGAQPLRGEYEDYRQALANAVFSKVTLRNLSGTNRPLTWDCLPRFMLHDSPREADLMKDIYHEVFRIAARLEAEANDEPPFQYIITTTEAPPDDVKKRPWLLDPVLNASEAKGRLLGVDL